MYYYNWWAMAACRCAAACGCEFLLSPYVNEGSSGASFAGGGASSFAGGGASSFAGHSASETQPQLLTSTTTNYELLVSLRKLKAAGKIETGAGADITLTVLEREYATRASQELASENECEELAIEAAIRLSLEDASSIGVASFAGGGAAGFAGGGAAGFAGGGAAGFAQFSAEDAIRESRELQIREERELAEAIRRSLTESSHSGSAGGAFAGGGSAS
jgi:hypothetical protein